jgi:hypothetical protein
VGRVAYTGRNRKQLARQVETVAHTLGLKKQIFPVSAQKGLVAKINKDAPLLAKTRLPALEYALSKELNPGKTRHHPRQLESDIHDYRNRPSFHRAAVMSWSRCWNSRGCAVKI